MSTTMTNILLPQDMVMDILSRLPVKSLLRFRCVSKPWKFLFSDPSFIKMHLNHSINNNYEHLMLEGEKSLCSIAANSSSESSLAMDKFVVINCYPFKTCDPRYGRHIRIKILGSCNGLLLIRSVDDDHFILNPSTKEFKILPKTPLIKNNPKHPNSLLLLESSIPLIVYGFGYDEITEDYKVVIINLFYDESYVRSEVKVYSLRSNSWRKIEEERIPYILTHRVPGRLVNGALHWMTENNIITNESYIIVSFNLGDEKYRVIEEPNYADDNNNKIDIMMRMSLNVLGGCLCIIRDFYRTNTEIWVMKDYGVKESWTKLFNISQPTVSFYFVRPIKFTKNGEVLFEKDGDSLFVYDPKHESAKTFQIRGLEDWYETATYVESLISLNSGTFVGQQATLKGTH